MAYSSKLDLTDVAEDKLSDFVNCTVHDSTFSPNTTNRAKKSLPKKLVLKPTNATPNDMGVWAQKLIHKGTRFGPIVGEIKPAKANSTLMKVEVEWHSNVYCALPEEVNKTWNVFLEAPDQAPFVIDMRNILKSNWMRFVQFAENKDQQNLLAYQDGIDIFFLATKDIQKDEELAVWYCKEFAARVDQPETPAYISSETNSLIRTIKTLTNGSMEDKKEEKVIKEGNDTHNRSTDRGVDDAAVQGATGKPTPSDVNGVRAMDSHKADTTVQGATGKSTPSDVNGLRAMDSHKADTHSVKTPTKAKSKKKNTESSTESNLDDYGSLCWSCSKTKEEVKLYKCGGCKKAKYCTRECIDQDWPIHKNWCLRRQKKREIKEAK